MEEKVVVVVVVAVAVAVAVVVVVRRRPYLGGDLKKENIKFRRGRLLRQ